MDDFTELNNLCLDLITGLEPLLKSQKVLLDKNPKAKTRGEGEESIFRCNRQSFVLIAAFKVS